MVNIFSKILSEFRPSEYLLSLETASWTQFFACLFHGSIHGTGFTAQLSLLFLKSTGEDLDNDFFSSGKYSKYWLQFVKWIRSHWGIWLPEIGFLNLLKVLCKSNVRFKKLLEKWSSIYKPLDMKVDSYILWAVCPAQLGHFMFRMVNSRILKLFIWIVSRNSMENNGLLSK